MAESVNPEDLADLLVERVALADDDIHTLALNAAIPAATRLHRKHFDVLSLLFLVRRTVMSLTSLDQLCSELARHLIPVSELQISESDVSYLASLGCLTTSSFVGLPFGTALLYSYGGLFSQFSVPEKDAVVAGRLRNRSVSLTVGTEMVPLLVPSELYPGKMRFNALRTEDVAVIMEQLDEPEGREFFLQNARTNLPSETEVSDFLIGYDAHFEGVLANWRHRQSASPTVTGIAIGHINARRAVSDFDPRLDGWIS